MSGGTRATVALPTRRARSRGLREDLLVLTALERAHGAAAARRLRAIARDRPEHRDPEGGGDVHDHVTLEGSAARDVPNARLTTVKAG
jgi:hypothetical protein